MIGVAGCGVKGLARFYRCHGFEVTGSDVRKGGDLETLREAGIRIFEGHKTHYVEPDVDYVVTSRAIPLDNPELMEAHRRKLPVETLSQALGRILRDHRGNAVAVAGTHGKTTTSAWLAHMLVEGKRDPSFIIGGDVVAFGGNIRKGAGPDFVVEACEYGGSFHDMTPTLGIILNVEDDHQECYGGPAGVREAFGRFARSIPASGTLVIQGKLMPEVREWGATCRIVPVGKWRTASGTRLAEDGYRWDLDGFDQGGERTLLQHGRPLGRLACGLPGRFSWDNLLFSVAAALEVGVSWDAIQTAARSFGGVRRRFENLGTIGGVTVIDDYAHHPTEVNAVLSTAKHEFRGRRLRVVFEPHQYRRLHNYFDSFARELAAADQVFVTDVFAARERAEDWQSIGPGPQDLVTAIRGRRALADFLPLAGAVERLQPALEQGDVVMTLGAGRSSEVAHGLVHSLR